MVEGRRRDVTAEGTDLEAFGPAEWGLVATSALLWGSSFLFIDVGLEAFEPTVVALARLALGTLTLAAFPAARRPVERPDLVRVAVVGVLWLGVPLVMFPLAQQYIDSSLAGMLNGAGPLISATYAAILLRRAPRPLQVVGLATGFTGIVVITVPTVGASPSAGLGIAFAMVALLCYPLAINVSVPLQQRYGALPVLLRGQLFALVPLALLGGAGVAGSAFAWPSAIAMVPLGVASTGLAYVAMVTLAGRVGASRGAMPIYFLPVVATVLGVVFLDERVELNALVGTALVIAGAWLMSRRER
ncbi:MAG: DMT family transporter [Actinobacteria bacterium]|nr:DMT family transporter [Actinomycetota bacterium]